MAQKAPAKAVEEFDRIKRKLEIKHPVSNEIMEFEAPLPKDLQKLLDNLRKFRKK